MKDQPDYIPDPSQMALWPDASGNSINGLGEASTRRPVHVYWHAPLPDGSIPKGPPFAPVQGWFYAHNTAPELTSGRKERQKIEAEVLPEVAARVVHQSPQDWAKAIRQQAEHLGIEAIGFAGMQPDWYYDGKDKAWRTIIVLGLAMDYGLMSRAPDVVAGAHVVREYARGMKASKDLTAWIRQQGHAAEPEHGPFAGDLTLIPAAIAAGLGELGKHGSLINRDMGSCFRLAAVLTDLPLPADEPDDFGADDFCARCQLCSTRCPPQAILPDKQTVRGQTKWYVDFDRCLPYFNETAGCGICVAVCPFSRPDVRPNLLAKLARGRMGG